MNGLARCRLAAFLALSLSVLSLSAQAPPPSERPPSIRQVLVRGEALNEALRQAREGVLVRLARPEFERLRTQANRQHNAPPRCQLSEAIYSARLVQSSQATDQYAGLVGSAQWKIWAELPSADTPALLLLDSADGFNLAVQQAKWVNRPALLVPVREQQAAAARQPALALIVEESGEQTLQLEWSARAEQRPDGLHVELRVPYSPVSSLELDLPAERTPSVPDGLLLAGPFPTDQPNLRRWKVGCGGRTVIPLILHPPPVATAVLCWQKTVQHLSPEGLQSSTALTLETRQPTLTRLLLSCDPSLSVLEVVGSRVRRWSIQESTGQSALRRILVEFDRPVRDTVVEIRSLAGLPSSASKPVPWVSPGLLQIACQAATGSGETEPFAVIGRGETLELHLHPAVRLLSWDPGDFRLTEAASTATEAKGIDSSSTLQRLNLIGGGLATGSTVRRPGGLLQVGGIEFLARQQTWWRPLQAGGELTAQIAYEILQGQLFQLAVRIPTGWRVDAVELSPAESLAGWTVRTLPDPVSKTASNVLLVELARPLQQQEKGPAGLLTIRLQGTSGAGVHRNLPLPDLIPLGANSREGYLGISWNPSLVEGQLQPTAEKPSSPEVGPVVGPWGSEPLSVLLPFRGQGPRGSLRLRPLPARCHARADLTLGLHAGQLFLQGSLTLRVLAGTLDRVELTLSAPLTVAWQALVANGDSGIRLTRLERQTDREIAAALAVLAARTPWELAVSNLIRPGQPWCLHFDRPLPVGQDVVVQVRLPVRPTQSDSPWPVPLIGVPQAERFVGTIRLPDNNWGSLSTAWMAGTSCRETILQGQRAYLYRDPTSQLYLRGKAGSSQRMAGRIDLARLVSRPPTAPGANATRHHLTLLVRDWPHRWLAIQLPESSHLVSVALSGHLLESTPTIGEDSIVHLPVTRPAQTEQGNWIELVYTTPSRRLGPCRLLELQRPGLPVLPERFEQSCLLPPGLVPLHSGSQPLTDRNDLRLPVQSTEQRFVDLFRLGWPWLPLRRLDERQTRPTQQLEQALQAVQRDHAGQSLLVTEWLALMSRLLGPPLPLLVDPLALHQIGLTPDSLVTVPLPDTDTELATERNAFTPWLDNDCVLIALSTGILLTRPANWLARGADRPGLPQLLEQAARHGHDASIRFLLWSEWLNRPEPPSPANLLADSALLAASPNEPGWLTWDVQSGTDPGTTLVLIPTSAITALGGGIAATGLFVWLCLPVGAGLLRSLVLLLSLLSSGLALAWLPDSLIPLAFWPLLTTLGVAGLWYLSWVTRPLLGREVASTIQPRPPSRSAVPAAMLGSTTSRVVMLAVCLGLPLTLTSLAQSPESAEEVVWIVPGDTPDDPGHVLLRPALHEQLLRLNRNLLGVDAAVLVSAQYEGKLVQPEGGSDRAEFTASFVIHCFEEAPTLLTLPLSNVSLLGDILLDGVRTLPVAGSLRGEGKSDREGSGLQVRLRGKGRHRLELRFQSAVTSVASTTMRQVRFGIPPLAQSRLHWQMPQGANLLEVSPRQGMQRLSTSEKGEQLEADLGAGTTSVQIRWQSSREKLAPLPADKALYREAHLWDLRADASRLTSLIQYTLSGAVASLQVELPPQLVVQSVKVRRPARRVEPLPLVEKDSLRLTNWTVSGNPPRLQLEFATPITGNVEVELDLLPRSPWGASVLLPVPRPVGQPAPAGRTDAEATSYLAYRNPGLLATARDWLRLTGIQREDFAPFWPSSTRPVPSSLTEATRFRRETRQDPELRLQLRPEQPSVTGQQSLLLQVGTTQVDFLARVDLECPDPDLSLLEWQIQSPLQPLTITRVSGADVSRWSCWDNRLLVWLQRKSRTQLEIAGWFPLSEEVTGANEQPEQRTLALPCLRLLQPGNVRTEVVLQSRPELSLLSQFTRNLKEQTGADPRVLRYLCSSAEYGGTFLVRRPPVPRVQGWTQFRLEGKELVFRSSLLYRPTGTLGRINLSLSGWPGDARLTGSSGSILNQQERMVSTTSVLEPTSPGSPQVGLASGVEQRFWTLELRPGFTGEYRCQVTGRLPLEELPESFPLPRLQMENAQLQEHVLVFDAGLRPERPARLVRPRADEVRQLAQIHQQPFHESAQVWLARDDNWQLELSAQSAYVPTAPQLPLAEMQLRVVEGAGWQQQLTLWLWHDGPVLLEPRWSSPGRLLRASVEGTDISWLPEEGKLPLPGRGLRRVVLCYQLESNGQIHRRPALLLPRLMLEDAVAGEATQPAVREVRPDAVFWTVWVPAGWQLERLSETGIGPLVGATRQAALALHRASALLSVTSREPADDSWTPSLQQRLVENLRLANWALEARPSEATKPLGPGGQSLSRWLESLQSAASSRGTVPSSDSPVLSIDDQPAGTAWSWQSSPGEQIGQEAPVVGLSPLSQRLTASAIQLSVQWLLLWLVIALIARSSTARTVARWLWPEQMLLLGLAGWQLAGPTVVVTLLLLLGIGGRLLLVATGLLSLLRRRS